MTNNVLPLDHLFDVLRLVDWIEEHPGLSKTEICDGIKALQWPDRLSVKVPATSSMLWKLRFLALAGFVVERRESGISKWYPARIPGFQRINKQGDKP